MDGFVTNAFLPARTRHNIILLLNNDDDDYNTMTSSSPSPSNSSLVLFPDNRSRWLFIIINTIITIIIKVIYCYYAVYPYCFFFPVLFSAVRERRNFAFVGAPVSYITWSNARLLYYIIILLLYLDLSTDLSSNRRYRSLLCARG